MCVYGRMGGICMCVREMGNVCVRVYGCNMCLCLCVCVVCVSVLCANISVCVYVCVCVCVWESERASAHPQASEHACALFVYIIQLKPARPALGSAACDHERESKPELGSILSAQRQYIIESIMITFQ